MIGKVNPLIREQLVFGEMDAKKITSMPEKELYTEEHKKKFAE